MAQHFRPHWIPTSAPPRVNRDTCIVAALATPLAMPAVDCGRRFVADFYAFNALFHGMGASQTWLSLMHESADDQSPEDVVDCAGEFAHERVCPNDRRVVLSHETIKDRLTPVTVVPRGEMVQWFLKAAKDATAYAGFLKSDVVLLVFCHFVDNENFALDCTEKTKLTITDLQDVLTPRVRVCLLAPSFCSGGWTVCTDLNSPPTTPIPFQIQFPGMVFVHAICEGKLLKNLPGIETATLEQKHGLTRAVWEVCRGFRRPWNEHVFEFDKKGDWDEVERRWHSLPEYREPELSSLYDFSDRTDDAVDDMYIGRYHSSIPCIHLRALVSPWLKICPHNWVKQCAFTCDPVPDAEARFHLLAMIHYRLHMTVLAESLLEAVRLPRPMGMSCLAWDEKTWASYVIKKHCYITKKVYFTRFHALEKTMDAFKLMERVAPAVSQGHWFVRFRNYLAAAIFEARLPPPLVTRVLERFVACIDRAQGFYQLKIEHDKKVQDQCTKWGSISHETACKTIRACWK